MEILEDIPTLKAMAKKGYIKLHNQTGKKIRGLYSSKTFICTYISGLGEGVSSPFQFKGVHYQVKYFDGCFCPYVVQIHSPKFVNI